jgi:hypothetical protein
MLLAHRFVEGVEVSAEEYLELEKQDRHGILSTEIVPPGRGARDYGRIFVVLRPDALAQLRLRRGK